MGTRKSSLILYFTYFSLINFHYVRLEVAQDPKCRSGCFLKNGDGSFPSCAALNTTECSLEEVQTSTLAVDGSTDSELSWQLADIAVYEPRNNNNSSTNYAFHLAWTLPSGRQAGPTQGFRVSLQSPTSLFETCHLLPHSSAESPAADNDVFTYNCYEDVQAGTRYDLTVTSLPSQASLQYTVQTVDDLTPNDTSSLPTWRTTLAVSMLQLIPGSTNLCRVHVIFQGAPANLGAQRYIVKLTSTRDYSSSLSENETSTILHLPAGLTYNVTLQVEGPSCEVGCTAAALHTLIVPDIVTTSTIAETSTTTTTTTSVETTTATTPVTTQPAFITEDPGVMVQPSTKGEEYNDKIKIISGTVAGVAVAVFAGLAIFCVIRKKRASPRGHFSRQRLGTTFDSDDDIAMEDAYKTQPSVLLVYSYDCEAHERVVIEFANYLKHTAHCAVFLDIWEQNDLCTRGSLQWMKEKLEQCHYVVVICSTGARFKCVRNQQFRMKQTRPIQDFFPQAVDHITERMQSTATEGDSLARFLVIYFDYAGPSDIPPKLDRAKSYCLMRDLFSLYCHLHGLKEETKCHSDYIGLTTDTFAHEDTGKQLFDALENAYCFFQENPEWLGKVLEPIEPAVAPTTDPQKKEQQQQQQEEEKTDNGGNQGNQKLTVNGDTSTTPSVNSEEESLLEERKKKRWAQVEDPGTKPRTDSVFGSKREKSQPLKPLSPFHRGSPLHNGPTEHSHHAYVNPLYQNGQTPDTEDSFVDDDAQLQRDIDFIQNFDVHHKWHPVSPKPADLLMNFDFTGGHTPPENFVSPLGADNLWPRVAPLGQAPPVTNGALPSSVILDFEDTTENEINSIRL